MELLIREKSMNGAAAVAQLHDVSDIHISDQPESRPLVVDARGEGLPPVRSKLMPSLDARVKKDYTLSGGVIALLGAVSIIVGILAYLLTGAMSYQSTVSRIGNLEERTKKIEDTLSTMQSLQLTSLKVEKDVEAIKARQAESEIDRKQMIKDIGDIRIMLARDRSIP